MPNINNIDSPICDGGSGRSGTSWVLDILGAKRDVQYVLENSLVYSLYRELSSSWWSEMFRQIECHSSKNKQQAKTIALIRDSVCRLFPSDLQHWVLKIIWGVCRTWGVPLTVWVELFPNARYIHCVRDPRETIKSIVNYLGDYSNAASQISAEHQFLRGHLDMLELKSMGVPYIVVKLEAIKEEPEMVFETLCSFCGLSSEVPEARILRNKSAAIQKKLKPFLFFNQKLSWLHLSKETAELSAQIGYVPDCDLDRLNPLQEELHPSIESLQEKIATLATENIMLRKRVASLSTPTS
jgi:hypothetical protein